MSELPANIVTAKQGVYQAMQALTKEVWSTFSPGQRITWVKNGFTQWGRVIRVIAYNWSMNHRLEVENEYSGARYFINLSNHPRPAEPT